MLRYISVVILLVVTALFLSTCKDDAMSPVEYVGKALGVPSREGIPPCFIRICNWSRLEPNYNVNGRVVRSKNQYLWAYLSDGSDFVDPKAIYFNNQPLTKLEVGQYQYYRHYLGNTENPQTSCLTIAGFDGNNYNIIGNIDDEIVFKNLDYCDTLDLSKGITIEYSSPRYGNDSAWIDMQYDYYTGEDGKKEHYYRKWLYVKDNHGSVHIPAEMLKEFPTSVKGAMLPYCTIELSRTIPTTEYVKSSSGNSMLVGKVYEASFTTHVRLKRD